MSSLSSTLPTRVACYARVSTEDQAERQTVQAQIDFDRRYCELQGLTIAGFYVDDGVSGTVPLEDRPDGRRLIEDARSGAFTMVLVYRLDRLGRSLKTLISAHEQLEAAGVAIRSGTEPFDTASPIGKFLFSLLGSMAELERATISERMTRGRDRVARQGQYTGGSIPFGYDLDDDRRLVPSTRVIANLGITEAEVVRDVFSRIATGDGTLTSECGRLTALGVPRARRYGGPKGKVIERTGGWGLSLLAGIVHNPVYKGTAVVESRYGEIERPAPALVASDTWERAQQALTQNRSLSKKNAKNDYLLRGLVTCGLCGRAFVGGTNSNGRMYRCSTNAGRATARPKGRCTASQIHADRLEGAVWKEVRDFIDHPEEYIADAQRELRARLADSGQDDFRRKALARELAGKEQERERVLDLFRRGRITTAECDRDLDKVAAETREIRELLDTLRIRAEMAAASEAYLSDVGAALVQMRENVEEIERTNDRAAMRRLIELLAPDMVLQTDTVEAVKVRQRKRMSLRLRLAFRSETAVVSITPGHEGGLA